jgi:hypothetical protein
LELFFENGFPSPFQLTRDEAVLRLHGLVLTLGPIALVESAFETLLPVFSQALRMPLRTRYRITLCTLPRRSNWSKISRTTA